MMNKTLKKLKRLNAYSYDVNDLNASDDPGQNLRYAMLFDAREDCRHFAFSCKTRDSFTVMNQ